MVDCGCPFMENKPGCYCGCRPCLEGIVDNCGFPCLALSCSKALINCCAGPCWRTCDSICGRDNKPEDRPSASYKPVVVFTSRAVKDANSYKEAFAKYAKQVQASTPGVRAMFSFMDKTKELTALQLAWYDSAEVLTSLPKDAALMDTYSSETGFGAVFGARGEEVQKALADSGVAYQFGSLPRGFVKSAPHPGFNYPGPPMIWVSKRWVQPGRMENAAKAFAKAGDLQYYTAPALLSSFEFTSDDNPDQLWSLRFFNDYEMGHVAHFPKAISWIPPRVLFTVIPELKGGLGAEFPVACCFSTKEDIDKAIGYNAGNKAYAQYHWDDVIGPMPDMSKGVESPLLAKPEQQSLLG